MKIGSTALTVACLCLGSVALSAPASAQDACPRASGRDAEAGWVAYGDNRMDDARDFFDAALARCPDDDYARTGMAYVLLRGGETARAQRLWITVIESNPNNIDALTGLGLAAWRAGDVEAVERHFSRVLALAPDHQTATEYMARLEGAAAAPTETDPAARAWGRGETELAFELYSERLAEDPLDGVATLRVALVEAWRGQYDFALELLDGLLERQPSNVEARIARARVRAWDGDVARAMEEVSEVLALQPDNVEALEALATFQAWSGDVDEALTGYDQLISIAPQGGAAEIRRAQTLAWSSNFAASRAAYDSLLARDPDNVDARLGLARTVSYQRDFDAAIREYDRVLADAPDEMRALLGRARAMGWAGRLIDGEVAAVEALETDEGSAEAWALLGQIYRWQSREAAAYEALQNAAALAPTNADVLDQLRSVELLFAPRGRPTVRYESDSDANRMITTSLTAGWHPSPRFDVTAEGFHRVLEQGVLNKQAQGVTFTGELELDPGWAFSASVGGSRSDGIGDPTFFEYGVGVSAPQRRSYTGSLTFSSVGLNETAVLAELGARQTELLAAGRWNATLDWRVDGSLGLGWVSGSEDNGRRSASLAVSRRIGRLFSLGLSGRAFSFEKNLDDGYFDPDFYGIAELTSYWLYRPASWLVLIEVAPGVQKVRADGDLGTSIRTNTRVGYTFGPGREISLSFAYSSAGLVSFATGTDGYSYKALVLGSTWTF